MGARLTKLTDFDGTEFDATISRDGKFVAFVSDRDGPFDVLVGQIGTGNYRNLTHGRMSIWWQKVRDIGFNVDGTEIWLSGGNQWRRMQSLPVMGGELRNFFGEQVVNTEWSPDGSRVVYHTSAPGDPLFVADRDGANPKQILRGKPGEHQHYPIWSSDGEWVYVVRGIPATGDMDLWRVRPDGRDPERLTRNKKEVAYPTPVDATTVLYVAREPDGSGPWLWALDVKRKVSRRPSFGVEQYTSISASKDGRTLVATVANPKAHLWSVPILDGIATEKDAKPIEGLRATRALAPRFGGDDIFYLSSHGTDDGLWRYRDGKTIEILKGTEHALQEPPAVSPDGKSVAVVLRKEGQLQLHILSADGTGLRPLSHAVDVRGAPVWSPDGRWIAIGGSVGHGRGLFKFPVNGKSPMRIARGDALNPVWSPTDDLIVYAGPQIQATHTLVAIRSSTGDSVELPRIQVMRVGERFRFLPNGNLVYMQGARPSQDFWLLDLNTMEKRQLTQLDEGATMRTFDIDPEGKRIVFDRLHLHSDIVLIKLAAHPE